MTVRRLLSVLAVLALFFAACGDDGGLVDSANESSGDESSGGDSDGGTGSDVDPSDFDPGDIDPGDLEAADDFIDNFVPEGCEFFLDFSVAMGVALSGQDDLSAFDVADAPAEVQDDVRTVLDAIQSAPNNQAALVDVFSDPEVEEALDNIDAFATANCDVAG